MCDDFGVFFLQSVNLWAAVDGVDLDSGEVGGGCGVGCVTLEAGWPLHRASSVSLIHSPKPTMPVHGAWQPSRTHSEADKKAFKCFQAELQAILALPGHPFRKEGALFQPLFELSLPKEHWRVSNEDNELGSEED